MAEPLNKAQREELYTHFLKTEGYLPDLERDDAVMFKKGDGTYFIPVDDDADFFQIMRPFWPIESEEERAKAARVANQVNARAKVAKLYFLDNDTWVSVQLLCAPPEAFQPAFGKCMASVEYAVEQFVAGMRA